MTDNIFSKSKHLFKQNQDFWFLLIVILIMLAWKVILLLNNAFPFNSDEAIVALMAKHILQGEFPIFFYGQAYMGGLDAYLVALGYLIFGQNVFVIRLVQTLLYACTIVITYFIGKSAFQSIRAARISAILMAIPAVNVTLYSTVSLGGYGEALLIGAIQIWLALVICKKIANEPSYGLLLFLLAFLSGFGLWVNGMTLVFSLPVWLYVIWLFIRKKPLKSNLVSPLLIILFGGLLGLLPILIHIIQNGLQAVWMELFGSAVAVEQGSWLVRSANHLLYLILFGIPVMLGIRPPWTSEIQLVWLLPLILPLALGVGYQLYADARKKKFPDSAYLLIGIITVLMAAFTFTSFGVDPSGRYFVPLMIPFVLLSGYTLDRLRMKGWLIPVFLMLFLTYHGVLTWKLAGHEPYITTQFYTPAMINHDYDDELMEFLGENDLTYGYTNYWVSYPLAFLSEEELIYIPALPYHPDLKFTERDNRYAPYTEQVNSSEEVSYIVTKNPPLDDALQQIFARHNISYAYHEIGDFHIYYHLSDVIRPDHFDLLNFSK